MDQIRDQRVDHLDPEGTKVRLKRVPVRVFPILTSEMQRVVLAGATTIILGHKSTTSSLGFMMLYRCRKTIVTIARMR